MSTSDTGASLRALAERRAFHIGAAVSAGPFRDDPVYREILAREFNMVTCENAMKFAPLRPSRDAFAWDEADAIVAFALAHGMAVRGHTLVWHTMVPEWFQQGKFGYDGSIDIVRDHIHTVVSRYRGKVSAWDVVNEGVEGNGRWRDTIFLRTFGPDYLTMAFHWAHEADPDAKLFYNDYDADEVNTKSTAIYHLLKSLLKQGVPIHGVGLQMHIELDHPPEARSVARNIRRFADLGLEVHVTEMDVRITEPATEARLREQARVYREILETCLAVKQCAALATWGITDTYSWVPDFFPGKGSPLLFDKQGRPKPAYYAIRECLTLS